MWTWYIYHFPVYDVYMNVVFIHHHEISIVEDIDVID
jgi:hypothetical protein